MTAVKVGVWERLSGSSWGKVGELPSWETLSVSPRFLAPGEWSMRLPWGAQAARLTPKHLLTFDLERPGSSYRLMTGRPQVLEPGADETGTVWLDTNGDGALGLLGGALCWPVPTAGINSQTADHYAASGAAETVLRNLVVANWATRLGQPLTVAASAGRGSTVRLRLRFANLLTVLAAKADLGGLGVRMGLVNTTSETRAEMTLQFYVPSDQSGRVKLSSKVGSLRSWKASSTAPKVTRAIVGGGGQGTARVFRQVQAASVESTWGWPQELFVDQRGTTDTSELDEAGQEALNDGAATSGFDLDAVEAQGIQFGRHFDLGDTVMVELTTGLQQASRLQGVQIEGGSDGVSVKLLPGDPDATNPLFRQAAVIRELRRQVRALQSEEG